MYMCKDQSPIEVYCDLKYLTQETNFFHTVDLYFL